jgi:hypothetical protein
MKRVYAFITVLIVAVILGSSSKVSGQRLNLPDNLVGVDLKEVQKNTLKASKAGSTPC